MAFDENTAIEGNRRLRCERFANGAILPCIWSAVYWEPFTMYDIIGHHGYSLYSYILSYNLLLLDAPAFQSFLKVALMDPSIGAVLNSFLNRQGTVFCSNILIVGIFIKNRWPNDSLPLLWHHGNTQGWELGATTSFDIVQVQKHGECTDSLLSFCVVRNVIMMCLVKLSHFIPQQLQILIVHFWNASHILQFRIDPLGRLIFHALITTPGIVRGATIVDGRIVGPIKLFAPHIGRYLVALIGPQLNEAIAFLVRQ
mmetsp:Transcript_17880/g.29592  ORF Transcript_17880/g.29592 Transcript_17880/m.29592 type:complete len:256 (+) Transcript_17880:160-927(+)